MGKGKHSLRLAILAIYQNEMNGIFREMLVAMTEHECSMVEAEGCNLIGDFNNS